MRLNVSNKFVDYFRVTCPQFEILTMVGPTIKKLYMNTEPLPPAERLAVTLSDGGVLHNSELGRRLNGGLLIIHPKSPLEVGQECFPYYFVGDEAFPLKDNLMRPYPGKYLNNMKKVFNYRLSRARRTIENGFGILASRWRIYRRPIIATLATSDALVKDTICLHNFLMANNEIVVGPYCPPSYIDCEDDGVFRPGLWREQTGNDCLINLGRSSSNTNTRDAAAIENNLAIHFMTEGAIEFQWNKASGV